MKKLSIAILILISLFIQTQAQTQDVIDKINAGLYGCKSDPNLCPSGGTCNNAGLCICDLYRFGVDCQGEVASKDRVEFKSGDITGGGIAGIVIGWLVCIPLIYACGYYAIKHVMKQRG